jgi:hypothetical protein
MAQPVIMVTYNLVIPEGTPHPKPDSSASHSRPIAPRETGYKGYYDALRAAIDEIKAVTGHELTVWRDAVGNRELGKEVGVKNEDDNEVSDEGESE